MKKFLNVVKIFAVLLLVVGCGNTITQSVTQKLAGEYVNYDNNGKEDYSIILEDPESNDDTSGNVTFNMGNGKHVYYGSYEVYESSKTVVIDYDEGYIRNSTKKLTYDLENNTLTLKHSNHEYVFEKQ